MSTPPPHTPRFREYLARKSRFYLSPPRRDTFVSALPARVAATTAPSAPFDARLVNPACPLQRGCDRGVDSQRDRTVTTRQGFFLRCPAFSPRRVFSRARGPGTTVNRRPGRLGTFSASGDDRRGSWCRFPRRLALSRPRPTLTSRADSVANVFVCHRSCSSGRSALCRT